MDAVPVADAVASDGVGLGDVVEPGVVAEESDCACEKSEAAADAPVADTAVAAEVVGTAAGPAATEDPQAASTVSAATASPATTRATGPRIITAPSWNVHTS